MVKNLLGRVFLFLSFIMFSNWLISNFALLTCWNHFETESRLLYYFPSQSVLHFVVLGFEKGRMNLGLENCEGIVSQSCIEIGFGTQARLQHSFSIQIFLLIMIMWSRMLKRLCKRWLTIWLEGSVSPLTRWRVEIIVPILIIILKLGIILSQIKPISQI